MTSTLLLQIPLFIVVVVVLFQVPGALIQRFSGFEPKSRVGLLSFQLISGLMVVATIYQVARRLELNSAFVLTIPILSLVGLFWLWVRRPERVKWSLAGLAGLAISLAFTGILLSFSHFADFQTSQLQDIYRDTLLSESVFHEGLINAMRFQFPPPAIYAAGSTDFSFYHLNMHLQIEAVNRLTGIPVNRLVYWYFPALYFFLLFSLPYAFVRQFNGSLQAALTSGALVFLGGFSWIPGLLQFMGPEFAWLQYFHAAPFSLYTLNSIIPALAGLFAILLALTALPRQSNLRYLIMLLVLMFGCFGLKSSMGLQIAAVLLFVGALYRNGGLVVTSLLALGLMLVDQLFIRASMGEIAATIQPGLWLKSRLSLFGFHEPGVASQIIFLLVALLLELGVRIAGLTSIRNIWDTHRDQRLLIIFILVFFVSGLLFSNIVFLGDDAGQFNHAEWFAIQSLHASWFLLFLFLASWKVMTPSKNLALILMLMVSMPSIAQLLWLKTNSNKSIIGPAEKEVVEYLESTPVDSIVMHPLNLHSPSLSSNLAGRISVLNVFRSFVNESQDLQQRASALQLFFNPNSDEAIRGHIFDYYGVTHVYGPPELGPILRRNLPVEQVMANDHYAVWKYNPDLVTTN